MRIRYAADCKRGFFFKSISRSVWWRFHPAVLKFSFTPDGTGSRAPQLICKQQKEGESDQKCDQRLPVLRRRRQHRTYIPKWSDSMSLVTKQSLKTEKVKIHSDEISLTPSWSKPISPPISHWTKFGTFDARPYWYVLQQIYGGLRKKRRVCCERLSIRNSSKKKSKWAFWNLQSFQQRTLYRKVSRTQTHFLLCNFWQFRTLKASS